MQNPTKNFRASQLSIPLGQRRSEQPVVRKFEMLSGLLPQFTSIGILKKTSFLRLPARAQQLLVHEELMTFKLEAWCGTQLDLNLISQYIEGSNYYREITLVRKDNGEAVLYALVKVNITAFAPVDLEKILMGNLPLGRIFANLGDRVIANLVGVWSLDFHEEFFKKLRLTQPRKACFGRSVVFEVDGVPAVSCMEFILPTT